MIESSTVLDGGEVRCGKHGHDALPYEQRLALIEKARRIRQRARGFRIADLDALARDAGITLRTLERYLARSAEHHVCACHWCGRVIA